MLPNETDPLREREDARLHEENQTTLHQWRDFLDISVTLCFELGRTKMKARSILDLDVHSIVQLTGSTGEGVDVLAGDQRLARGEIIMIEDRTGVRINEVIVQEHS